MPSNALAALAVFAAMFVIWAVVPSLLKKRHETKERELSR